LFRTAIEVDGRRPSNLGISSIGLLVGCCSYLKCGESLKSMEILWCLCERFERRSTERLPFFELWWDESLL